MSSARRACAQCRNSSTTLRSASVRLLGNAGWDICSGDASPRRYARNASISSCPERTFVGLSGVPRADVQCVYRLRARPARHTRRMKLMVKALGSAPVSVRQRKVERKHHRTDVDGDCFLRSAAICADAIIESEMLQEEAGCTGLGVPCGAACYSAAVHVGPLRRDIGDRPARSRS